MKRTRINPKRPTPRRREAPRWDRDEWDHANHLLIVRSGDSCECCGQPLNGRAERAHRVRRRDGGDRLSNVLLLLPEHHARTHQMSPEDVAAGLILRTTDDPATIPVLWRGGWWVLLDDYGNKIPVE